MKFIQTYDVCYQCRDIVDFTTNNRNNKAVCISCAVDEDDEIESYNRYINYCDINNTNTLMGSV